jgi:hypothetical protein
MKLLRVILLTIDVPFGQRLDSLPFLSYRCSLQLGVAKKEGTTMFLILAVVLFIVWIGGFLVFKTAGLLIHLLLLFAIISIVMHFVSGKRAV